MVAAGEADVLEVVVLAARANALLRGRGPVVIAMFGAEEDVLELVHARIGEEQGRVVGGNQGGRVHAAVPLRFEVA